MTTVLSDAGDTRVRSGPPVWLIAATGVLAVGCLGMAVAETSLWMHYLIDAGESVSLVGLAFIFAAGLYLSRRGRLLASLPLVLPWLLFPVITQGDQIIDNLSIGWMRFVSHVLLGALFGMPVAIIVLAARYVAAPPAGGRHGGIPGWTRVVPGLRQIAEGRLREGSAILAAVVMVAEIWIAVRFLGVLMVITLLVMIALVLAYGMKRRSIVRQPENHTGFHFTERVALGLLLAGVAVSLGLFFGFKNRPGAYQGSPSYYMDPSQPAGGYRLDGVPVPTVPAVLPSDPDAARAALTGYARAFERLLAGYYVLDRNYNYHFHNELFLRRTPLLPDYRAVGLRAVADAEALRAEADRAAAAVRPTLPITDPLGALLADVSGYAAFTFGRVPVLEAMSGEFERTKAGLQHATHLFEGEGKVLGVRLADILAKHDGVLASSEVAPVTSEFVTISRAVHDAYANRIVGF